jgi:hypothetical protein
LVDAGAAGAGGTGVGGQLGPGPELAVCGVAVGEGDVVGVGVGPDRVEQRNEAKRAPFGALFLMLFSGPFDQSRKPSAATAARDAIRL